MMARWFFSKAYHYCLGGKLGLNGLDPALRVKRECRRQVLGHGHSGDNSNVERAFLKKDAPDLIVRFRPPKLEPVRRFAVLSACRSEIQAGVILPPRSARFLTAGETRMNIGAVTASSGRRVILQPGAGQRSDHQIRRLAVWSDEVNERTIAFDELMLSETPL